VRRLIPVSVGLVISAAAIAILIASSDVASTLDTLSHTDLRWLVLAGGVIAIQLVLRAYRWRGILPLRPDGRRIRVIRLLPVLLVGYLGNAVLPARLGEPLRAALVSRREQVGMPEALGSVLLERLVDVVTLAGLVLTASVAVEASSWIIRAAAVVAAAGACILVILATWGVAPLVTFGARFPAVARRRILAVAMEKLERLALTVGGPHRRRVIGLATLISAGAWILEATTYWLVGRSVGIDLSPMEAMVVAGIAVLGTAVPSAPGYIGTFDLAAAVTAQALGVARAPALAFAVLVHATTLLPLALGGALALVSINFRLGSLVEEAAEPALRRPGDR
jgi:uncharacterized protein (TIRG00374 family)